MYLNYRGFSTTISIFNVLKTQRVKQVLDKNFLLEDKFALSKGQSDVLVYYCLIGDSEQQ
jgi:hypothetical protein